MFSLSARRFSLICAILLLLLAPSYSSAASQITVDGSVSDWVGTHSGQIHTAVVNANEWIYKGELGDRRTDPGMTDNQDLMEVRLARGSSYLYILVKLRDISDDDSPYIALCIDTDHSSGDTALNFQGDDSDTGIGPAELRCERQVALHTTATNSPNIELFADDGSSWYAPPNAGGASYQISISEANNLIEARIALADLGMTTTSAINVAVTAFVNSTGYNNTTNATGEFYGSDGVDTMGGAAGVSANAWGRDLSDGDIDQYFTVDAAPLAVELAAFTAQASAEGVTLAWETVSETANAGFNVYRGDAEAGPWKRLNAALIPAAAPGSSGGHAYAWTDASAGAGQRYWYLLEDVALDGAATRHGPVALIPLAPNAVGLAGPLVVETSAVSPALAGLAALAGAGLVGAGLRRRRRG